ncbi:MAG TPA: hypothetical protein VFQ38_06175 [Longimicrobiales bacterium]|nr:hypothetical protein [Longimicrobiales bacterium]
MSVSDLDLTMLREMWARRRAAAAEVRHRIDPAGMTRPARTPEERAWLREHGGEGVFLEQPGGRRAPSLERAAEPDLLAEPPAPYPAPVDRLLTLGEASARRDEWLDYPRAVGLDLPDVPALIRMASDRMLLEADLESLESWAPIHAWRSLAQLEAVEAVEPLLALLDAPDNEWLLGEFPALAGMIGRVAIGPLTRFMHDPARYLWARSSAAEGLGDIATRYPVARDEVVGALVAQLERYPEEDETLNALVIGSLLDLDAVEAAPLIERAFAEDAVDLSVNGDWEDVQVELGLLPERLTPRPPLHPWLMPRAPLVRPALAREPVAPSKTAAKAKARRKAAKRSRKRNRRGR